MPVLPFAPRARGDGRPRPPAEPARPAPVSPLPAAVVRFRGLRGMGRKGAARAGKTPVNRLSYGFRPPHTMPTARPVRRPDRPSGARSHRWGAHHVFGVEMG